MKKVDYLIVGQGIAGTLLAWELKKSGQSIFVLNKETENTSSNKAGGLYNPITGRKMVKTWLADEIFPTLETYYADLEKELGASFLFPKAIYRPFFSIEEQNDWQGKASADEFSRYIKSLNHSSLGIDGVEDPFGGLELQMSGSVDLPILIQQARKHFRSRGEYAAEVFEYEQLELLEAGVRYKNFEANRVVFCEGPDATSNPLTNHLPFKPVKGELLKIRTALSGEQIVNRGVFILPKEGFFKVGSTYDHARLDHEPTEAGRKNITERLAKIYKNDFEVVDHTAGVRPATFDRRPFVGMLGSHQQIGVFNGFGTKGVSLVPFFATQFVNYLLGKGELYPEVDLRRVEK
ncbi:MAG: FAD-dependent oxidoreductase [Cyclobacteriaceae bacterium]